MSINEIHADLTSCSGRFAIVAGKFNQFITDRLISGAVDTLSTYGIPETDIDCIWVPGAYEIPLTARILAESAQYKAIIALGAVIRGGTPHFDYVAGECAAGITRINESSHIPVIFGVLTTDTTDQAIERAGLNTNKGCEAATAALEMVSIMSQILRK
ncbi:MAG: 6,7-dimethyl-8-ribityllumazine synthase [Gammaproteobacteria bacterium]|nr:6,7-dimethyl-8-ribityllumazine synthase [Gammaproteobacteria bacterium]MCY4218540.1 6,7-dimethyl-8-ribityllumazine synthase [Gammaproteobacteria bacterium]MCY4275007.1 6,7-dimethyl-8-ribityllumazine synthase [Gammaproteobacteria bacterium]